MRVLVTGGAGFIGRHLVRALLQQGDTVLILDNLSRRTSERPLPAGAAFSQGDIGSLAMLQQVLAAEPRFDVIYHLAAQSQVMSADRTPAYTWTSNVIGTRHVALAAAEAGIQRIVFTSSREVYGDVAAEDLPVAEDAPLQPKNLYGLTKATAEEALCHLAARSYGSLRVAILRLANVYGPGDCDRVIPRWIEQASHDLPLTVYGGEQVLDFAHVSLVVQALLLAGRGLADGAGPINIGSGQGITLQQLAARIQPGGAQRLCLLPARDIEVVRFVADVSRMRTVLGLQPPADPLVGLEDLLKEARHAHATHA